MLPERFALPDLVMAEASAQAMAQDRLRLTHLSHKEKRWDGSVWRPYWHLPCVLRDATKLDRST